MPEEPTYGLRAPQLPDDLREACDHLNKAGAIVAKRLASDGAPKYPSQARALASAIAQAQSARSDIAASTWRGPDHEKSLD